MQETKSLLKPQYLLKHRIIGGLILITIAIVVIPLLFSEPTSHVGIEQPTAVQRLPFQSVIEPLNQEPNAQNQQQRTALLIPPSENTPVKSKATKKTTIVMTNTALSNQVATVSAIKTVSTIRQPQTSSSGWTVRVGTFTKQENAQKLIKQLRAQNHQPHRTEVNTKLGLATRIWLGPYAKRTTADNVSRTLKELTGEEGYVSKFSS